jgi:HSP20 family protein
MLSNDRHHSKGIPGELSLSKFNLVERISIENLTIIINFSKKIKRRSLMSNKSLIKTTGFLPSEFDDFLIPWNEWFTNSGSRNRALHVPATNITENKDGYKVSVAAPGLKKSDFKIDVEGNMLSISSEKEDSKEEKDARYTRKEYSYSSFSRSFTLPEEINQEKIEASYEDGVLRLTLPKKEEAKKAPESKHIAVK